ncbi:MAG: TM0106 family RecB-like putative nuclease [Thermosynechococcaceae cyanobacterium]
MILTDQLLLSFQRCHRHAFLEMYGDPSTRGQTNDFLRKLIQDKKRFQQTLTTDQTAQQPDYPPHDWHAGAAATQDLMRQGVPIIRNGVLLDPTTNPCALASTPDLLIRRSGVSVFGDWLYVPVDVKLSKRPKLEYQILSAFHATVLATVQQADPEIAWLYLRDKGWYAVDLSKAIPLMADLLAELAEMLVQQAEPEVFIARNRCSMCVWFDHCYAIAQSQNHLSLIPGVTPTRYPVLQAHGLNTVETLAQSDPVQLHAKARLGMEASRKLVSQAQAFVQNQPVFLAHSSPFQTLHNLPTAPVELYFDIEAEPSLNLVYLHGVLVVDRLHNLQQFYPFLAKKPDEEPQAWQDLVFLFQKYPDAPIFHFCSYEVQTVARLAKAFGAPDRLVESLIPRCFDLHEWVTRTVSLPIESYTLKLIASWVGFEWRNTAANGAQAICWYSQWLETGDVQFLDDIVRYNEDDCRATYRVKDWLTQFLQQQIELTLPPVACGF